MAQCALAQQLMFRRSQRRRHDLSCAYVVMLSARSTQTGALCRWHGGSMSRHPAPRPRGRNPMRDPLYLMLPLRPLGKNKPLPVAEPAVTMESTWAGVRL